MSGFAALAVMVQGRVFFSFMVIHLIQHLQSGSSKSNDANSLSEKKKLNGAFLSKQQENEPKLIMTVVVSILCFYGQKQEAV